MRSFLLSVGALISLSLSAQQKKPDVFAFFKQDTSQKISETQLLSIVTVQYNNAYKKMSLEERSFVDKEISKLKEKDSVIVRAMELSTTANVLMAKGRSASVTIALSAAAVKAVPQAAILINNLGAALHRADSLKPALKVLLYARSLQEQLTPVILTNLGNVLFALQDDRSAEVFLRKALRMDPAFSAARESLVMIYLKRKDIQKAYEELLAGVNEVSFSPVFKPAFETIKNKKRYDEKKKTGASRAPRPVAPDADGKVPVPMKQLTLPEFPNWADRETMMHAAGSLENWKKELSAEYSSVNDEISAFANKDMEVLKKVPSLPYEEQKKVMDKFLKNYRLQKLTYGLEVLELYYEEELDKVWYRGNVDEQKAGDNFKKEFEVFSTAFDLKHKELLKKDVPDMNALQNFYVEQCKKKQVLIDGYYKNWREIAKERHNRTNDLLHEYWVYSEPYLNQVYDLDLYDRLDAKRRQFVLARLQIFPSLYSINSAGFAIMGLDIAGGMSGKCAEAPAEEPAIPPIKSEVPAGKASDCPFQGKIKFGFGPGSLALDCTSIEVEAMEGVGGSIKYDFKAKETTVLVGVGYKAELNFPGAENLPGLASFEASAKAGPYVKFNSEGEILDYGGLLEIGGTATLGKNSAGVTHTSWTSTVTGINAEVGTELSRKVF